MEIKRIIQNEVKCKLCNDIIWSAHRHDFKYCKCGSVAVDGGMEYIKRVGNMNPDMTEERSMRMDKDALKACTDAVKWAKDTGRNDLGVTLAVIRVLREHRLLNMDAFK